MFGLFSNKKKFEFNCPMCEKEYAAKFNPAEVTEYDYPHWYGHAELEKFKCDFCKVEMTLLLTDHGKVKAIDEKWEVTRNKHDSQIDEIDEQIQEIEDQIEDEGSKPALEKKKQQLKAKQRKLEAAFETKEDRYMDRQSNWLDKRMDREED